MLRDMDIFTRVTDKLRLGVEVSAALTAVAAETRRPREEVAAEWFTYLEERVAPIIRKPWVRSVNPKTYDRVMEVNK